MPRITKAALRESTLDAKQAQWANFIAYAEDKRLAPPISATAFTNFLASRVTLEGQFFTYGHLRSYRATVVNTLKLVGAWSEEGENILSRFMETAKRESPDKRKYDKIFNMDIILIHLQEREEKSPSSGWKSCKKDDRAEARMRASTLLKIDRLFRSDDILHISRGGLLAPFLPDLPSGKGLSHWGPTKVKFSCGKEFPKSVSLLLTQSKTGKNELIKVSARPSQPDLCPVRMLYLYIALLAELPQKNVLWGQPTDSVWLGNTAQAGAFRPVSSAQTLAKDSLKIMTDAGLDPSYRPHALRHASASAAVMNGVAEEDILEKGRWRSSSVFHKFYKSSIVNQCSGNEWRALKPASSE